MRMPRLITGLVAAGLLGVTPFAVGAPAQATAVVPTASAIAVDEPLVSYGDEVSITASVKEPDGSSVYDGTVALQVSTAAAPAWTTVATDDASGYIYFNDIKPTANASYKLVYSGYTAQSTYQDTYVASESTPVTVGVSRAIKAKTPGLRVVGKVTPDYKKGKVKVFRKVGKKYKPFKTVKTDKKSKFSVKLPAAKRGKKLFFRLYIPADASFTATVDDYYTYSY
ncbi:hypothetical protein [Nocardioides sp. LHG3406-4]|uniref:hypothetical protein n=1 Tax=Nocardioides sp. LHG3406-4 TaxID=2804575 RepID=UPI003CEE6B95